MTFFTYTMFCHSPKLGSETNSSPNDTGSAFWGVVGSEHTAKYQQGPRGSQSWKDPGTQCWGLLSEKER